jgi:type I restriction-modification system DNA methylase subunit
MLEYLKVKREELEAKRIEPCVVYKDLEKKIDEYRSQLYAERDAEVTENNKLIDAQVAILDEVIGTAEAIEEAKKLVDDSVDDSVHNDAGEVDEVVDETVYNEQKESEF